MVRAEVVVYGVLAFTGGEYLLFVVTVAKHIAQVLDIKVFSVFEPKERKTK